jgi:hypothetical protein
MKHVVRAAPKRETVSVDKLLKEIAALREQVESLDTDLLVLTQRCDAMDKQIEELQPDE